jgi:hypothetical protein
MIRNVEQLKQELSQLNDRGQAILEQVQDLNQALGNDYAEDAVPAPYHFKLILEKVQDLFEERLLPALQSLPHLDPTISGKFSVPVEDSDLTGRRAPEPEEQQEPKGPDETGRRIIPRYNQRLLVRYMVPGRDKTFQRAYSRDIGAMGLFVVANRLEKSGQSINMEIDLPDGTVKMQGTVVWTKWVPPALRAIEYPGFAVKIHSAPEPWFAYFMQFEEKAAAGFRSTGRG